MTGSGYGQQMALHGAAEQHHAACTVLLEGKAYGMHQARVGQDGPLQYYSVGWCTTLIRSPTQVSTCHGIQLWQLSRMAQNTQHPSAHERRIGHHMGLTWWKRGMLVVNRLFALVRLNVLGMISVKLITLTQEVATNIGEAIRIVSSN